MALNKEDKKDVKNHLGKALANKVSDATKDHSGKMRKDTKVQPYDSPNRLTGSEKDKLRKKYGTSRLTGSMMDDGRRVKANALKAKTGGGKAGTQAHLVQRGRHVTRNGLI